jgi:hypothetical protein
MSTQVCGTRTALAAALSIAVCTFTPAMTFAADCPPKSAGLAEAQTQAAGVPIDRQHFEGQMQAAGSPVDQQHPVAQAQPAGVPIDRQHFEGQMQAAGSEACK